MRFERTILLQRLTAGFFLVLFLFIHIAKAMHHHDRLSGYSKGEISKSTRLASSPHCDICAFQLAKDAHHFAMMEYSVDLPLPRLSYMAFRPASTTSVGPSSSDRGPPPQA